MVNVWVEKEVYLQYAEEYDDPDSAIQEVVEEEAPNA